MDFADDDEEVVKGLPAWMGTFADLMSLLMCFFVLLLSFSEMDAQKYKLVAGSMKNAFGIQREVLAIQNPSGSAQNLENTQQAPSLPTPEELERKAMLEEITELMDETQLTVDNLEKQLANEINEGFIDVESGFGEITIRIKEKGSFDSGSADFQESFLPVMDTLRDVLSEMEGKISVEGHTDDIDINTRQFPSNWALSSARALSVAHELLKSDVIDNNRFIVVGYADTKPFVDNSTPENRASNRRVELVIKQDVSDDVMDTLRKLEELDPNIIQTLESGGELPVL